MERLTIKAPSGLIHLADNKEQTLNLAIKKLSEYEDLEEQGLLLKLPCNVGDTVKLNACCECISILPNTICPFESDCDCEDCGNGIEREFTTTIESVYNNGFGWYVTLKHFDIEIPISDFGRTIFLTEQEAQAALEKMKGDKPKQYVLVSQGIEIYRTTDKEEAERMMNESNAKHYEYLQRCADEGERPADNMVYMHVEE